MAGEPVAPGVFVPGAAKNAYPDSPKAGPGPERSPGWREGAEQAAVPGSAPESCGGVSEAFGEGNEAFGEANEALGQENEALGQANATFGQAPGIDRIVQSIRDIVWSATADDMALLYINPAAERILGRGVAELLTGGRLWLTLIHPEDQPVFADQMKELARTGAFDVNVRLLRPQGSVRWLNVRGWAVFDQRGERVRIDGIASDISTRKSGAAESRHLRDALGSIRAAERRRIARDLHDELGQYLVAIKISAAVLSQRSVLGGEALQEAAASLNELSDAAIDSMRRLIADLRPSALDQHTLLSALGELAADFSKRHGIRTRIHAAANVSKKIDGQLAVPIYRIVQESLNNVAKHAQAKNAVVRFVDHEDHIELVIEDDGRGMSEGFQPARSSFGLLGMRERAAEMNGVLRIRSSPGSGTRVEVQLPHTPLPVATCCEPWRAGSGQTGKPAPDQP